jgi:hypothetical protein
MARTLLWWKGLPRSLMWPAIANSAQRHGHVSQDVFDKIVAALAQRGVELVPEGERHGAGARWAQPRTKRLAVRHGATASPGS